MKTNQELQSDVQRAIIWELLLNTSEIKVTAINGVVFLTGIVDSSAEKMEAENTAKKVIGVNVLVNKIEVKFRSASNKTDEEIANEALVALKANWSFLNDRVTVKVEHDRVILEGELYWN